jgi:hypothetical protein
MHASATTFATRAWPGHVWQRATAALRRPSMSCSGGTQREDRPRRMAAMLGHPASSAGRTAGSTTDPAGVPSHRTSAKRQHLRGPTKAGLAAADLDHRPARPAATTVRIAHGAWLPIVTTHEDQAAALPRTRSTSWLTPPRQTTPTCSDRAAWLPAPSTHWCRRTAPTQTDRRQRHQRAGRCDTRTPQVFCLMRFVSSAIWL